MPLTKEIVIDKIEILSDGQMQIRQATKILEDGKEISKAYHRWVLVPGQDTTDQTQKVKDIALATWTQAVIDAYIAAQAE